MGRLLGGKQAKLLHMLKVLGHLLGGFTAETTLRISAPCATLDRLIGGKESKLAHILKFQDHLLGGFSAKTTIRISKRLKNFGLFTRGIYRGNDHPKKI